MRWLWQHGPISSPLIEGVWRFVWTCVLKSSSVDFWPSTKNNLETIIKMCVPPAGRTVSPLCGGWCWDDATRGGGRGSSGCPHREADIRARCCCRLKLRTSRLPATANEHPEDIYQRFKPENQENLRSERFLCSLTERCLFAGYANIVSLTIALATLALPLLTDSWSELSGWKEKHKPSLKLR